MRGEFPPLSAPMAESQPNSPGRPEPILVIGHKNPDTDAICSAVGYAEFLREARGLDTVAACCGGINPRTEWVLEYAGVEPPRLVMDVRPTAGSICRRDVVRAHPDESFLMVYNRMKRAGVRSIPLVDDRQRVTGLPTVTDLLQLLMHSIESGARQSGDARRVRTSLLNMAEAMSSAVETNENPRIERDYVLMVAASSEDLLKARLGHYPPESLVVVVGDRPNIHRIIIDLPVKAVVLTGGARLSVEDREKALDNEVAVIYFPGDTASAVQLIRCSPRVGSATASDFRSVPAKALVSSLVHDVQESRQFIFPVLCENEGTLLGVFSKSDLLDPPRTPLVLVDHNEFSQAVTGADEAEIIEVIDHHRLGGNLVSREPIRFINEPVGSTSTIVARNFRDAGIHPQKGTAICLCAGMISDTLNLTSPTTTDIDREILVWLGEVAGIDLDDFAARFFAAGSMLRSAPADKLINADRKEYKEHGWRISISQIEEVALDGFMARRAELEDYLDHLRCERELDHACLLVTDITRLFSLLLVSGNESISRLIDYPRQFDGVFRLDGVVSRKKQFFPYISRVLARASRNRPPETATTGDDSGRINGKEANG